MQTPSVLQRAWLAPIVSATIFHVPLLVGYLAGWLNLGEVVLGTLLGCLVRIGIWTPAAIHRRRGSQTKLILKETLLVVIGISLGVWGYVGIIKGASTADFTYLGLNYAGLELLGEADLSGLGDLFSSDDDGGGEAFLIVLALLALALFCYSMYLLYEVIAVGDPAVVALLLVVAVVSEAIAYFRHLRQTKQLVASDADAQETHQLRVLARMMFLKGWGGALVIGAFTAWPGAMALAYIGWSWLYESFADQLLQRWFPARTIPMTETVPTITKEGWSDRMQKQGRKRRAGESNEMQSRRQIEEYLNRK